MIEGYLRNRRNLEMVFVLIDARLLTKTGS